MYVLNCSGQSSSTLNINEIVKLLSSQGCSSMAYIPLNLHTIKGYDVNFYINVLTRLNFCQRHRAPVPVILCSVPGMTPGFTA